MCLFPGDGALLRPREKHETGRRCRFKGREARLTLMESTKEMAPRHRERRKGGKKATRKEMGASGNKRPTEREGKGSQGGEGGSEEGRG